MAFTTKIQDHSCDMGQSYPPQMDRSAHRLEKLCYELEQTNRILRFVCYLLYYERENLFDVDHTAMRLGLGPKKKKKKYGCTILDILGGGLL